MGSSSNAYSIARNESTNKAHYLIIKDFGIILKWLTQPTNGLLAQQGLDSKSTPVLRSQKLLSWVKIRTHAVSNLPSTVY